MKKTLTYLIAVTVLVLTGVGAMAQGGQNPYVGSTHDYTVAPGNASNDLDWLVDGTQTGSGFLINSGQDGATVNITWREAGTYVLTFTETDANLCSTTKQMTVTVTSSFEVSTSDPAAVCNAATDTTNSSLNVTSVVFIVNMNTGVTAWNPEWEIKFSLTNGGGVSIGTLTASDGNLSGSGTGPYTLTNISSPNSDGTGATSITVPIYGDAFTLLNPTLTITEATELDYSTTDSDSGDWGATGTINPIPNTSAISTD